MINLTNHRHEALNPPLNNINDTRNGIALASQLHRPFGTSAVAFLQVSYLIKLSSTLFNQFIDPKFCHDCQ